MWDTIEFCCTIRVDDKDSFTLEAQRHVAMFRICELCGAISFYCVMCGMPITPIQYPDDDRMEIIWAVHGQQLIPILRGSETGGLDVRAGSNNDRGNN